MNSRKWNAIARNYKTTGIRNLSRGKIVKLKKDKALFRFMEIVIAIGVKPVRVT